WFDREREGLTAEPKRNRLLETILVPLLIKKQRWADAGAFYADPMSTVKENHEFIETVAGVRPAAMDDATFEDVRRQVVEQFQNTARQVHRYLVAAGRLEDAAMVASAARELDPTVSPEWRLNDDDLYPRPRGRACLAGCLRESLGGCLQEDSASEKRKPDLAE